MTPFKFAIIFIFTGVRTWNFVCYNKILSLFRRCSELTLPLHWTVKQFTVTSLYNTNLLFCVKKEIGEETFPSACVLFTFLWTNELRPELRGAGGWLHCASCRHCNNAATGLNRNVTDCWYSTNRDGQLKLDWKYGTSCDTSCWAMRYLTMICQMSSRKHVTVPHVNTSSFLT